DRDAQDRFERHGPAHDRLLERGAVLILHHDEHVFVVTTHLIDRADCGMAERGGRTRFTAEAYYRALIVGQIGGQELEGDEALEFGVPGLVDDTHAATPEPFEDVVMRDRFAE